MRFFGFGVVGVLRNGQFLLQIFEILGENEMRNGIETSIEFILKWKSLNNIFI